MLVPLIILLEPLKKQERLQKTHTHTEHAHPIQHNQCHNQKNLLFQFVNNTSVRDGLGIKHQRFLGSWLKCVLKNKVPKSDSDCLIRFFVLFTYHLITR